MGSLPDYTAADFAASFAGHKPVGAVWPREADTDDARTDAALMPTYVRSWRSIVALIADAFPATTARLLPEWEASLGLPDPCAGPDATLALRRAHVVARLTQSLGPTLTDLTAFAAALGTPITITEFRPARFPVRFGGTFGGPAWAHAWMVSAPGLAINRWKFGVQKFGDPFTRWTDLLLICELRRIKPAHTALLFDYGGRFLPSGALLLEAGGFLLLEDGAGTIALE